MLLLNGIDHAFPEARTAELAEAVASRTGFAAERGLLDAAFAECAPAPAPPAPPKKKGFLSAFAPPPSSGDPLEGL